MKRHSCTTLPESRSMATRRGSLSSVSSPAIAHDVMMTVERLTSSGQWHDTRTIVSSCCSWSRLARRHRTVTVSVAPRATQHAVVEQTHLDLALATGVAGKRSIAPMGGVLLGRHGRRVRVEAGELHYAIFAATRGKSSAAPRHDQSLLFPPQPQISPHFPPRTPRSAAQCLGRVGRDQGDDMRRAQKPVRHAPPCCRDFLC